MKINKNNINTNYELAVRHVNDTLMMEKDVRIFHC